jgi:hypothetical protein
MILIFGLLDSWSGISVLEEFEFIEWSYESEVLQKEIYEKCCYMLIWYTIGTYCMMLGYILSNVHICTESCHKFYIFIQGTICTQLYIPPYIFRIYSGSENIEWFIEDQDISPSCAHPLPLSKLGQRHAGRLREDSQLADRRVERNQIIRQRDSLFRYE